MGDAQFITRRKSLKFCLSAPLTLPLTTALPACKPQVSKAPLPEGIYTEKSVRLPTPKRNRGYKAPQGRFPVKTLTYDGNKRQYHAYKPNKQKPPQSVLLLLHGSNRSGASLVDKWQFIG